MPLNFFPHVNFRCSMSHMSMSISRNGNASLSDLEVKSPVIGSDWAMLHKGTTL